MTLLGKRESCHPGGQICILSSNFWISQFKRDCVSPGCFKLQCLAPKIILACPLALGQLQFTHTPTASLVPQQSASLNDTPDPSPCVAQRNASTAVILKAVTCQHGTMNKLSFHCFFSHLYIGCLLCFVVTSMLLQHLPVKLLTRNYSMDGASRKKIGNGFPSWKNSPDSEKNTILNWKIYCKAAIFFCYKSYFYKKVLLHGNIIHRNICPTSSTPWTFLLISLKRKKLFLSQQCA